MTYHQVTSTAAQNNKVLLKELDELTIDKIVRTFPKKLGEITKGSTTRHCSSNTAPETEGQSF